MILLKSKIYNYIFIAFIVVSLIGCIFIGILTKKSYVNDTDINLLNKNSKKLNVAIEPVRKNYFNTNIKNYDDLSNSSDYILKVKTTNDRKNLNKTLLTKCEVIKTYKSKNSNKVKKYIYIYEPSTVFIHYDLFLSAGGYVYMKPSNEYYVFLKDLKLPKGYRSSSLEKDSFMYTNPEFSKFNASNDDITAVYNKKDFDTGKIKYFDIKDYDKIFTSLDEKQVYTDFKQHIKSNYD